MGIFSGRHDTDDPEDEPIDDAASFDVRHRQHAIQVRKQMEAVWNEILSHYEHESRRQRYIRVRRRYS